MKLGILLVSNLVLMRAEEFFILKYCSDVRLINDE